MTYSFVYIHQGLRRFIEFGSFRLLREYMRMGLIGEIGCRLVKNMLNGRSLKSVYPYIADKVDPILIKRYGHLAVVDDNVGNCNTEGHSDKLWFCWLQGIDDAPDLVKACLASQRMFLKDREFVVISLANYKDYVSLPDFIEEKYRNGIIPNAMFADLLRLELLIKFGGTWIDATVLCTGDNFPRKVLNCRLFMFQYVDSKSKCFEGISNWFIISCAGNSVLVTLRNMLYAYWRDYNCVVEYYIFHLFFSIIVGKYPEVLSGMPRGYSLPCLMLGRRIGDEYDSEWMDALIGKVCFHKLNYRLADKIKLNMGNFYDHIIKTYKLDMIG